MNNEKTLDGALCAGVGTADAATAQPMDASGSAPAEGKKKYVPPTMQVIPLGPQRMLATSASGAVPCTDYCVAVGRDASNIYSPLLGLFMRRGLVVRDYSIPTYMRGAYDFTPICNATINDLIEITEEEYAVYNFPDRYESLYGWEAGRHPMLELLRRPGVTITGCSYYDRTDPFVNYTVYVPGCGSLRLSFEFDNIENNGGTPSDCWQFG
ncbi:MAG: hypothetical protein IJ722_05280, partial [Alloprevotella sp.]|nr:hypothetical protein [Alloprevotella sp.]